MADRSHIKTKWHQWLALCVLGAMAFLACHDAGADWQWRNRIDNFKKDERVTIENSSSTLSFIRNPSGSGTAINKSTLAQPPTVIIQSAYAPSKLGLSLWLDSTAGYTLNPDSLRRITSWVSRNGDGVQASAPDINRAPTLVANAIRSRPAIRFDGAQTYLRLTLPDAPAFSVFIVGRFRSSGAGTFAAIGRGGSFASGMHWSIASRLGVVSTQIGNPSGGGYVATSTGDATQPWVVALTHDNTTSSGNASVNGVGVNGLVGIRQAGDTGYLVIGANPDLGAFSPVDIGEIRIYSRRLGASELANVLADLRAKWSI